MNYTPYEYYFTTRGTSIFLTPAYIASLNFDHLALRIHMESQSKLLLILFTIEFCTSGEKIKTRSIVILKMKRLFPTKVWKNLLPSEL